MVIIYCFTGNIVTGFCALVADAAQELNEKSKDCNSTETELTSDMTLMWSDEDENNITVLRFLVLWLDVWFLLPPFFSYCRRAMIPQIHSLKQTMWIIYTLYDP